jgi:hypothetical protein
VFFALLRLKANQNKPKTTLFNQNNPHTALNFLAKNFGDLGILRDVQKKILFSENILNAR